MREYPHPGTIAGLAAQQGYNICFLDVASNQEQALPLISEAVPALPVVAMNPANDADLILRCLRRGACEFVSEATAEQVKAVLGRQRRPGRLRSTVCCPARRAVARARSRRIWRST
jgi:DNA-binding NtrC family response regulator